MKEVLGQQIFSLKGITDALNKYIPVIYDLEMDCPNLSFYFSEMLHIMIYVEQVCEFKDLQWIKPEATPEDEDAPMVEVYYKIMALFLNKLVGSEDVEYLVKFSNKNGIPAKVKALEPFLMEDNLLEEIQKEKLEGVSLRIKNVIMQILKGSESLEIPEDSASEDEDPEKEKLKNFMDKFKDALVSMNSLGALDKSEFDFSEETLKRLPQVVIE